MPRTKSFDRQKTLVKAMEVFWEHGYHATSMQQLVEELGVNRASLYDTYGDKRRLFEETFAYYRKHNLEDVKTFLWSHRRVREGLSALLGRLIESSLSDEKGRGCFVINMATEMLPADHDIRELLQTNRQDFEMVFAAYLQRGVDSGELSADTDVAALSSFFYSFQGGLRVSAKVNPDKALLKAICISALTVLD